MAIRYMGSKRALAPEIAQIISDSHPKATILDVFAGMCAVGTEIVERHTLFTNDIHLYATTYAAALFTGASSGPTSISARSDLARHYSKNKKALEGNLVRRLQLEDQFVSTEDARSWRRHLDFLIGEVERAPSRKVSGLGKIAEYKAEPTLFPYCLITSYFSGAYFGLRQAIEIDSLRYAIDQAPVASRRKYLAALMEAASHCAATPGHFAQFLVPRDKKTVAYIKRIRRRSVLERFFEALDNFPKIDCANRAKNRVYNADATTLLQQERKDLSRRELVIYADPPYSRAQYSRYYHLLETLILYDYPQCHSKGRYREGRIQTEFSKAATVVEAMDNFASAAAETGAALYLSYPRNGLLKLSGGNLREILRSSFRNVKIVAKRPLQHSTLGAAPGEAQHRVWEDVFYASN